MPQLFDAAVTYYTPSIYEAHAFSFKSIYVGEVMAEHRAEAESLIRQRLGIPATLNVSAHDAKTNRAGWWPLDKPMPVRDWRAALAENIIPCMGEANAAEYFSGEQSSSAKEVSTLNGDALF